MLLSTIHPLSKLCRTKGIINWDEAIHYIQNLAYGRNSNRKDLSLVLTESQGTCSSKHAFLKQLAQENEKDGVLLILGMYKMSQKNTPGIGNLLKEYNLTYLPEAHCYLKLDEKRIDITSKNASFKRIENDILEELEITPEQVNEFKVNFHKDYLKKWNASMNTGIPFQTLWYIREACIKNLSQHEKTTSNR